MQISRQNAHPWASLSWRQVALGSVFQALLGCELYPGSGPGLGQPQEVTVVSCPLWHLP